jgi:arginine decarboxylase
LIICNGYKDESYIELALLAHKMGRRIYLVVEKLNELRLIADIAKRLKIKPNVGIRIKLSSTGSGKWSESGGDQSKFGLNSSELLEALDFMERRDMKDCLKLIHFHIGSQINKIRVIKNALREATQFYVQLADMGFAVNFIDIGGGLGVDYDGTRSSSSDSSMNYSIQEYANDSVSAIVDACQKHNLPHPNIITESGRSLTAHHSVLIFEVLETTQLPVWKDNAELDADAHELARELYDIWDNLNQQTLFESWHDALQIREEALDRFSLGLLDLKTRAQIEKLFWSIAREVGEIGASMKHVPEELRKISKMIPDKYFCNFSLFQSLPDSWAIDQIFPIIPISRLDEKPTRTCTLQDMTCDSDGKIANFIAPQGTSSSLPVHPLRAGEPYYLGVFLVGAYQEILGDMHNLFGDTNAVHIDVYKDRYEIDQIIEGESVDEVLDYVQFSAKKLVRNVEAWVTASMKAGTITPEEGRNFISTYRSGLFGYTYLERD